MPEQKRAMYPIMMSYHPVKAYVPRDLLDEQQALKNHDQTLDRLAERGGLAISEAYYIARREPWPYGRNRVSDEEAWRWFFEATA